MQMADFTSQVEPQLKDLANIRFDVGALQKRIDAIQLAPLPPPAFARRPSPTSAPSIEVEGHISAAGFVRDPPGRHSDFPSAGRDAPPLRAGPSGPVLRAWEAPPMKASPCPETASVIPGLVPYASPPPPQRLPAGNPLKDFLSQHPVTAGAGGHKGMLPPAAPGSVLDPYPAAARGSEFAGDAPCAVNGGMSLTSSNPFATPVSQSLDNELALLRQKLAHV